MSGILQAVAAMGGGGGGPSDPYRYWRLYIEANDGDANYSSIGEMEIFDGATDRTGGASGTATASSANGSDVASLAFDDAGSSEWITASGQSAPSWIAIDLGAQYPISSYTIRSQRIVTGRTPSQWKLQANNTGQGTGDPWVDIDTRSGETGWGIQELRTYVI